MRGELNRKDSMNNLTFIEKLYDLQKRLNNKFSSAKEFWEEFINTSDKIAEEHFSQDKVEPKEEKMSRHYPIICSSCGGKGWINNPLPTSSTVGITCPACKGNKIVEVRECKRM